MTTRSRHAALSLGFLAVIGLATASSLAQGPAQEKSKTSAAAKKKFDPSRRVPSYFGQLSLSPDQRESIYKIRKSYVEKIDTLRKEIDKLENQMMSECEGVLTETQKKLLEDRRQQNTGSAKDAETSEKAKTPAKK
jgi:Spy/CpxP family protein refolding chaperone